MDDLKSHFRMGYAPNNCVDGGGGRCVRVRKCSRSPRNTSGRFRGRSHRRRVRTKEPEQLGERRVTCRTARAIAARVGAFHVPETKHPDDSALDVLETLLTHGQSSRLYSRLVDKEQLVLAVDSFRQPSLDPGLLIFSLQPRSGVEPARAEKALLEELDRLRDHPLPDQELRKAKNQLLADHYRELKTISGRANLLGTYEVFYGDYRKLYSVEQSVEAVTAADMQRVARQYLTEKNRTIATLVPADLPKGEAAVRRACGLIATLACCGAVGAGEAPAIHADKCCPNGVVVDLMPRPGVPLVGFRVLVKGGAEAEPADRAGLASVTAQLLRKGTAKRTADQFSEELDFLGGSFSNSGDDATAGHRDRRRVPEERLRSRPGPDQRRRVASSFSRGRSAQNFIPAH